MATITPGSRITLTVIKPPTNRGAEKTIKRLLEKDKAAMKESNRQRAIRKRLYAPKPRGGRFGTLGGHVVKQQSVKVKVGAKGTMLASLDVLRDINSVQRFVEVAAA